MSTTTLSAGQSFRNLPRRRFSKEEKHQIVREFLHLDIPLARFARERDLHYNQLSRWRKDYLAGKFGPVSASRSPDLQWIPVKATEAPLCLPTAGLIVDEADQANTAGAAPTDSPALGRIQIRLSKGTIVLEGSCSASLLRTLIESLQ
ncbi:IS66-like element accessory protein TnpA [Pusillimonas sp.]|uniref:IS66-like element accessory protein TnpA n=1 Tax=Pusillimonas sp. TaxID=3040095 RepID=UPI0029B1B42F|nr:transposase [Pusillimonas sp.]MDX3894563.1 transposase [Pusillimonas sp.]